MQEKGKEHKVELYEDQFTKLIEAHKEMILHVCCTRTRYRKGVGDTMLYNSGVQAFIAKYVNPIFMQQTGTREQQHIVWNQTLDFSAQPSPIALNATATSGLPVHYASSNPGVAYIDGENLFFAGEGDATVTATQPGNYLFFAAQPVTKPVITPSGHNPGTEVIE